LIFGIIVCTVLFAVSLVSLPPRGGDRAMYTFTVYGQREIRETGVPGAQLGQWAVKGTARDFRPRGASWPLGPVARRWR